MSKLSNIFTNASNVILDVVDDQYDFMHKKGALSINQAYGCKENADEVIAPTNRFLAQIPANSVDFAVIKFDTHFADEYKRSPESKAFPNPHCLYGTPGWNLAVNIDPLVKKAPTYIMAKNEFDMWGSNPTGVEVDQIKFTGNERKAYDNLFKVIPLKAGQDPAERLANAQDGKPCEAFMQANKVGWGSVVVLFGVSSDVCDAFAMAGYLKRGATVVVVDDLVRGIGAPTTFAPNTGTMAEVVDQHFAKTHPQAVAEGRLIRAQSGDVLKALRNRQNRSLAAAV